MIKNPFRKKGTGELNKDNQEHEAEIVDLAEEQAQQEANQAGNEETARETQAAAEPTTAQAGAEAEWKNKLARLQADFDNYRKRTVASRTEAREEARRELLLDLLPVFDNFQRALGHAQEQEDYGSLRTGIEGIMMQMRELFNRHNLQEIPASAGTAFDPSRHNAVGTVPGSDDQHDTVAQEVLKGFEMNGYVVRPAQVLVYA